MVSIREKLRKESERIAKLEAENKYWRDCQPIQLLHQACLLQDNGSNIEEISAQLNEIKDWISDITQDGQNFLPSFIILTFRSLVAIREKFRIFVGEWKDFLLVKDLAIPKLHALIELLERYLERTKLVDGGMRALESWFVALTIRLRILEETGNEIAQHSLGIDTSISTMMSDVEVALYFEDIEEENINEIEFGSRLDELGKVSIKKKHLDTLASLISFIIYVKEYEKDHEKTLQEVRNMMNSNELKIKHTSFPPMKEINERLAKFIALAKKMKEKGRIILEDHLM